MDMDISIDISMDIHGKSVDMDMDEKFHIHGKSALMTVDTVQLFTLDV